MWIMSDKFFVSVVCPRTDEGRGRDVETDRVMIRARDRVHLERLRDTYPALADAEIAETPGADYPVRMFAPKPVFAEVAREMVLGITYDNFKGRVSATAKTETDRRYLHALHQVWSCVRNALQRRDATPPRRETVALPDDRMARRSRVIDPSVSPKEGGP